MVVPVVAVVVAVAVVVVTAVDVVVAAVDVVVPAVEVVTAARATGRSRRRQSLGRGPAAPAGQEGRHQSGQAHERRQPSPVHCCDHGRAEPARAWHEASPRPVALRPVWRAGRRADILAPVPMLQPVLAASGTGSYGLFYTLLVLHVAAGLTGFASIGFAGTYAGRASQFGAAPDQGDLVTDQADRAADRTARRPTSLRGRPRA